MSAFLLLSLLSPDASAFCGYYAGSAGASIYNEKSVVAIARTGEHTTLTLANDFSGDVADFALIIPVPQVLTAEDVREVDPTALLALDAYSAPRLVSYGCDIYYGENLNRSMYTPPFMPLMGLACSAEGAADMKDGGAYANADSAVMGGEAMESSVTVAAQFLTGVYEATILDADESTGLLTWLTDHGYGVSDAASALLQEYIGVGSYFLVVKVATGGEGSGVLWLPPLQIAYDSSVMSLPIRLGALSSAGEQDVIMYTLTGTDKGQVGIANYPQATLADECMTNEPDFGLFYDSQFSAAVRKAGDASWVREYSWVAGNCDPCTTAPLDDATVQALGRENVAGTVVSRFHMRYTPDAIHQDLVFYDQGFQENDQARFIQYAPHLTSQYPVCNVGMVTGVESECPQWIPDTGYGHDQHGGWLCSVAGFAPAAGGIAFAMGAVVRRRKPRA